MSAGLYAPLQFVLLAREQESWSEENYIKKRHKTELCQDETDYSVSFDISLLQYPNSIFINFMRKRDQ